MDNLKTFFGKQKIDQNKKTNLVQDIFTDVSSKYDLMNDLMSFGAHRLWKKRFVEIMNIQNNDKMENAFNIIYEYNDSKNSYTIIFYHVCLFGY